jgi:hypothetical protein
MRPSSHLQFISGNSVAFNRVLFARLVILAVGVALAIAFPSEGFVMADALVTLLTGAGVNTPSGNQSQVESDILIGDPDTAMPLRGIKVNIGGKTTIDVQGSVPLVSVLAKFSNRICGTVISLILRIATGRMYLKDANCNITFTNDAATTPGIFWFSQKTGGRPIEAGTDSVNLSASKTVMGSEFAGLFCTPVANIGSFDVTFADDTQQRFTVVEADALFARTNDTEANGRLDPVVTGFDNMRGNIKSVKINANGVGNVVYMTVK